MIYEHTFMYNKNMQDADKELFALVVDVENRQSLYYSRSKQIADSIYTEINRTKKFNQKYDIPNNVFKMKIFKNNDKIYHIEKVSRDVFGYLSEDVSKKWILTKDTLTINGYHCNTATIKLGGRIWKAYYTNQIPLQDGPYKFKGLPGLILQIESSDKEHIIKMVAIKQDDKNIKTPKFLELKNRNKLLEYKRNFVKSPSAKARIEDSKVSGNTQVVVNGEPMSLSQTYDIIDNEVWDFMKKYNNPIEKDDIWIN
ncbi:MAG: GLPGLI family protein [Bergeyella zoohelcum]|nr:GLPGLI family protein [Bergeyella zoohelcum]